MSDLNVVTLGGRLVADPEVRQTEKTSVCSFTIGSSSGFGDNEKSSFYDIVSFGKQADAIAQYFVKGKPITIVGRLSMDRWQDKESGDNRSKVKVILEQFHFPPAYDNKKQGEASEPVEEAPKAPPKTSTKPKKGQKPPVEDDEDIPF